MPISQEIDKNASVIYRTVNGLVATDDLPRSLAEILNHSDYRPGMKSLTDIRQVKPYSSEISVDRLVLFVSDYLNQIKCGKAAVVVSEEGRCGMKRMLKIVSDHLPIEINVFLNIEDARTWVEFPTPQGRA